MNLNRNIEVGPTQKGLWLANKKEHVLIVLNEDEVTKLHHFIGAIIAERNTKGQE